MLSKETRLGSLHIPTILKTGSSVSSGGVRIKFLPNKVGISRFAVVVSKKVGGDAPGRNLLRRRVFGCLKGFSPKHPVDAVILLNTRYTHFMGLCEDVQKAIATIR